LEYFIRHIGITEKIILKKKWKTTSKYFMIVKDYNRALQSFLVRNCKSSCHCGHLERRCSSSKVVTKISIVKHIILEAPVFFIQQYW
jgi:hypothetical protein